MSNINVQVQTWTKFISDLETEIEGLNGSSKLIEDNNTEIKELKESVPSFFDIICSS